MRIKIGKISRMFGLTPSTLRYYERMGLVHPEVDEETKFRYFRINDVVWILLCREHFAMGYSGSETLDIVYKNAIEQSAALLERHRKKMRGRAERAWMLADYVDGVEESWREAHKMRGHCAIWTRPAMWRLDFEGEKMFSDEEKVRFVSKWLEYMPYVYLQQSITPQQLLQGTKGIDEIWGLGIDEKTALKLGVPDGPYVRHLPETSCVHTSFDIVANGPLYPHYYAYALDYIERHAFVLEGETLSRVASFDRRGDERTACIVFDLPIIEKNFS